LPSQGDRYRRGAVHHAADATRRKMPQTGHCSRALFRCSVIQSAPLETKMAGTVTFCPAKFVGVVPSRPDACGIRSTHLGAVGSEHEISSANFTTMHWRSCCGRQPDQIGAIQVGNQGGRTAPIGSGATLRSDTETRFVRSGKPVRPLSGARRSAPDLSRLRFPRAALF
jgi:hypothetical protein